MSADSSRRLGRGLEALISTAKQREVLPEQRESELQAIQLSDIAPNPFQPRRVFAPQDLIELEASLKSNGLLQPITVRPASQGGFELVAGERRLRAATRLGWTSISAVVRPFDDRAMLTLALVENLQRANLNPLEEAEGYRRLIDDFGLTQQQVGDAVGKDRTTITTLLRLLNLPAGVRQLVENGQLTAGHARALLAMKNERHQMELANQIIAMQLSVRDAEARARTFEGIGGGRKGKKGTVGRSRSDPAVLHIEEQMRRRLQTDVSVKRLDAERGTIEISYYSHDDLDRVLELLIGPRSDFD